MNEQKTELEFMQSAEFRKTWSIAFFNATNAAVELVKCIAPSLENTDITKSTIIGWRDWLLSEHAKYYKENIAIAGMQSFTPMVEEGLKKAKQKYESTQPVAGK
jgi:hypothetical protein